MHIKTNLPLKQAKFAMGIISRHAPHGRFNSTTNNQKNASYFWRQLYFVYAFPLVLIKRNTSILQKTGTLKITNTQIQNQTNTRIEQTATQQASWVYAVNSQILNLQNNPLLVHFNPHDTLYSLRTDFQKQEKPQQTPPQEKTAEAKLNQTRFLPVQNRKSVAFHAVYNLLPKGRLKTSLVTTHFLKDQLVERALKLDNPAQNSPVQTSAPMFGSQELISIEHVVLNPSQPKKAESKQTNVELAPSVPPQPRQGQGLSVSDVNSLADKVYQLIERKARIERERRG